MVQGFLIDSEANRNMAFATWHAGQMPLVQVDTIITKALGNGLTQVDAIVSNPKLIPTHTQQDLENRISPPNLITLTGGTVVAGFTVTNALLDQASEQVQEPATIRVSNIAGGSSVRVRWIVQGGTTYTVTAVSQKGGTASKSTR